MFYGGKVQLLHVKELIYMYALCMSVRVCDATYDVWLVGISVLLCPTMGQPYGGPGGKPPPPRGGLHTRLQVQWVQQT